MKLFFDTEFTGLHKETTLISIGITSESGELFYCELTDYDESQLDNWITANIIMNLKYDTAPEDQDPFYVRTNHSNIITDVREGFSIEMQGDSADLKRELTEWLAQFEEVEMWSDCLAYDWVLFCDIWGHAFNVPKQVYYIPFDICTMMKDNGVDPDVNREEYSGMVEDVEKHNALWDAEVIKACHLRLERGY